MNQLEHLPMAVPHARKQLAPVSNPSSEGVGAAAAASGWYADLVSLLHPILYIRATLPSIIPATVMAPPESWPMLLSAGKEKKFYPLRFKPWS
jgi:hypothetical protein